MLPVNVRRMMCATMYMSVAVAVTFIVATPQELSGSAVSVLGGANAAGNCSGTTPVNCGGNNSCQTAGTKRSICNPSTTSTIICHETPKLSMCEGIGCSGRDFQCP